MKLYTPEATRRLLKPTSDGCGYTLTHDGQMTGLVPSASSWGPLDVQDVLRAVASLNDRFPLGWLGDYPVFVTDLQYMYYDGKTWSDTGTVAKTYPQYVILCAQADYDEPRAAMTIVHELGHVVMLKLTDSPTFSGKETPKLAEYRRVRGLGKDIGYGWYWEDQLYEVFAEDFRWLFGSQMARLERFRTMDEAQDPKPPGEEVRRWFLSLLPNPVPEFHIEIVRGEEKPMSNKRKVYLSPSTQEANQYAGGLGTEEQHMQAIGALVEQHLVRCGFEVRRNRPEMTLEEIVRDSNAWRPDAHIAIHSNAGGGQGTECWYYAGSTKGRALAEAVYAEVAQLTPASDRGVKATTGLYELAKTSAPACILEVAFHDRPEEAAWIVQHREQVAEAIAKGICKYFGVAWVPEPRPVPAEPPASKKTILKLKVGEDKIYRNGEAIALDVPAQVENGRTLIPLRAIAEALGCFVHYDAQTKEITITKEG